MRTMPNRQRGVTLLVSLIMLILMTLLALTTFRLGKSSLQIVGNMQNRNEAITAAQETIEEAISTTRLFDSPDAVIFATTNPDGTSCPVNNKCFDVNGDGKTDIQVVLSTPTWVKAQVIQNSQLDLTKTEDANCSMGTGQSLGTLGSTSGDSICADSVWELNAVATDLQTQAKFSVTEGVSIRVSTDTVATTSP